MQSGFGKRPVWHRVDVKPEGGVSAPGGILLIRRAEVQIPVAVYHGYIANGSGKLQGC